MFGSKKRVRIEFFDVDTGQMIGFDEKRPKNIPPTFRFETLIKIGGKTWKLIEAEPFERKKFLKSGLLKIKVRLEEDSEDTSLPPIPAEEKLHRSASRSAHIPESAGKRKGKLLEIGRWEWRSIELISQNFRTGISREMGAIEAIRQSSGTEQNGQLMYRKQHTRDLPDDAVKLKDITVAILNKSWFPFSNAYDGVNLMGDEGTTTNTFAFRLPAGLTIYGHTSGNKIGSIGLIHPDEKHKLIAMQDIHRLAEFMEAQELVLVDWGNNKFVEPILPALATYFGVEEADSTSAAAPVASEVVEEVIPAIPDPSADEGDLATGSDNPTDVVPEVSESEPSADEEMLFTAHSESPPASPRAPKLDDDSLELTIDHTLSMDAEPLAPDEEE